MDELLKVMNSQMDSLGLNYEFDRMTQSPPQYPYWVGEYTESEPFTEDGEEQISFFLTGFTRNDVDTLETQKSIIKEHFKHGVSVMESGSALFIYFVSALNTPLEDGDLRKCQITLQIKLWKGQ